MKITLLILLACVGVMAVVGMPAGWDHTYVAPPQPETALAGTPLTCDVLSSRPCHLEVASGPRTVVDRGRLDLPAEHARVTGTFRYVQEQQRTVLYVYDEVQDLRCRVVNPAAVLLLDVVD